MIQSGPRYGAHRPLGVPCLILAALLACAP